MSQCKSLLFVFLLFGQLILFGQIDQQIKDKPSKWDTITSEEQYHFVTKLNSRYSALSKRERKSHRLDSLYNHTWLDPQNSPPQLEGKQEYIYSDSLEIRKNYLKENSWSTDWTPVSFAKYKLNKTTKMLECESVHLNWNGSDLAIDTLTPYSIDSFYYNQNNLLTNHVVRNQFPLGLDSIRHLVEYKYDSLNRLWKSFHFLREFQSDSMTLRNTIEYGYNESGLVESFDEYRKITGIGFVRHDSIHYSYDEEGILEKRERFAPNGLGAYILDIEEDYFYSNENKLLRKRIQRYNTATTPSTKLPYYIDENYEDNESSSAFGDLYLDNDYFGLAYRYKWEFDIEIESDKVKLPIFLGTLSEYDYLLRSESGINNMLVNLENNFQGYKVDYFYSLLETSSDDDKESEEDYRISPNPVSNMLCASEKLNLEYSIYDLTGKIIDTGSFERGTNCIDISELEAGIYFFNSGNASVRFVKI